MSEVELTSQQREFVEHGEGPLLIVAGDDPGIADADLYPSGVRV